MTFTIREPGSAITHFIAMMVAILASIPLLIKAELTSGSLCMFAMAIFMGSMILLYGASTTYHAITVPAPILKIFRKVDHMMIFVLIAGSYTPICLITLGGKIGYTLLAGVCVIAIFGILLNAFWITCPKWFSSLVYIAMGWVCLSVIEPLWNTLPRAAFFWLLIGGLIYTAGGIIYALKLPLFNSKHKNFGSHEIFHLFVMAGSICHFIFMFQYVA